MRWPEEPLDLPADRGGGFYNVSLGAILASRYKVVRKLAWDQHANDVKYDPITCSFHLKKMTPCFGKPENRDTLRSKY